MTIPNRHQIDRERRVTNPLHTSPVTRHQRRLPSVPDVLSAVTPPPPICGRRQAVRDISAIARVRVCQPLISLASTSRLSGPGWRTGEGQSHRGADETCATTAAVAEQPRSESLQSAKGHVTVHRPISVSSRAGLWSDRVVGRGGGGGVFAGRIGGGRCWTCRERLTVAVAAARRCGGISRCGTGTVEGGGVTGCCRARLPTCASVDVGGNAYWMRCPTRKCAWCSAFSSLFLLYVVATSGLTVKQLRTAYFLTSGTGFLAEV